jgi:hypothetical protein
MTFPHVVEKDSGAQRLAQGESVDETLNRHLTKDYFNISLMRESLSATAIGILKSTLPCIFSRKNSA